MAAEPDDCRGRDVLLERLGVDQQPPVEEGVMDPDQVLVTVGGGALIAAVLLFFFGRRPGRRPGRGADASAGDSARRPDHEV
jgi:hypothetical protein